MQVPSGPEGASTRLGELGLGDGENEDWNSLPSKLEEELLQKQGTTPPDRYRRAIDAYFKRIGAGRRSLKKGGNE